MRNKKKEKKKKKRRKENRKRMRKQMGRKMGRWWKWSKELRKKEKEKTEARCENRRKTVRGVPLLNGSAECIERKYIRYIRRYKWNFRQLFRNYVDRYTCRTPHFHMYRHSKDHTAQMSEGAGRLKLRPQKRSFIHASCFTLRLTAH